MTTDTMLMIAGVAWVSVAPIMLLTEAIISRRRFRGTREIDALIAKWDAEHMHWHGRDGGLPDLRDAYRGEQHEGGQR